MKISIDGTSIVCQLQNYLIYPWFDPECMKRKYQFSTSTFVFIKSCHFYHLPAKLNWPFFCRTELCSLKERSTPNHFSANTLVERGGNYQNKNLKLEKSSFAQIAIKLCRSILLDIFGLFAHGSIMLDVYSSEQWVWAMDQG